MLSDALGRRPPTLGSVRTTVRALHTPRRDRASSRGRHRRGRCPESITTQAPASQRAKNCSLSKRSGSFGIPKNRAKPSWQRSTSTPPKASPMTALASPANASGEQSGVAVAVVVDVAVVGVAVLGRRAGRGDCRGRSDGRGCSGLRGGGRCRPSSSRQRRSTSRRMSTTPTTRWSTRHPRRTHRPRRAPPQWQQRRGGDARRQYHRI